MKLYRYLVLILMSYFPLNNNYAQWIQTTGSHGNSVTSFARKNNILFATTWGGGVFISTDNGISWNLKNSGLPAPYISKIITSNNDIFIGTSEGIFHSTNDGDNWSLVNNSLKAVEAFAFMDTIFWAGDWNNGLFMSTDRGVSWTPKSDGLTNPHITSINVLDPLIYTTTYGGGIFLSTDSGSTWINNNNGLTNDTLGTFIHLDSYYFVSSWGGGVFRSTDQGNHWFESNNGLTSLKALSLVSDNHTLFLTAYEGGVFSSYDFGQTWHAQNDGLTTLQVQSLFINNPYILVGAKGGKIFRRLLSEVTGVESIKNSEKPSGFKLNQNYPNPFNAETTISFELDQPANITLQIYDIRGKKIQTALVNEFYQEGYYSIYFSTSALAGGLYFYKLSTNNGYSQTKKMCVMK